MRTAPLPGLALIVTLLTGAAPAAAAPYSALSPDRAKSDFALGFRVDADLVVDALAFDLPKTARTPHVILGRYRERTRGPWTFPGAVVYAPCKGGFCLHAVSLGHAATRLAPIAIIDLDAPRTAVPLERAPWYARDLGEPARAKWPAVVIALERQSEGTTTTTTTDLVIISLGRRRGDAPEVVFTHPLTRRWPDTTDEEMRTSPRPANMTVGTVLASLAVEHTGKVHRVIATEQPLDSRWSGCLPTKPYTITFVLDPGPRARFREVLDPTPRPRPCE